MARYTVIEGGSPLTVVVVGDEPIPENVVQVSINNITDRGERSTCRDSCIVYVPVDHFMFPLVCSRSQCLPTGQSYSCQLWE